MLTIRHAKGDDLEKIERDLAVDLLGRGDSKRDAQSDRLKIDSQRAGEKQQNAGYGYEKWWSQ